MQVQVATPVQTVPMTLVRKVSGGELAVQVRENGRVAYWMNGKRIDRASARRKIGL
jgi:hypothetical protein